MFNPTQIAIEAFIRELRAMYGRNYGALEPGYPGVVSFVAYRRRQSPLRQLGEVHRNRRASSRVSRFGRRAVRRSDTS